MTDDRYTHVTWHDGGKTVNKWTAAALEECERRLGYSLTVVQGSYNTSVGASAGTHAGGGAVDLMPYDWENKVHVLRAVGFAAWHRPTLPGVWGEHIHAILIGDEDASSQAKAQITDYRNHRDGLASHAADNTWHPDPIPTFHYPPKPPTPARRLTLATFNLLRGRPANTVLHEVLALIDAAKLDGLAVQEAEGYFQPLNRLKGFDYFADPENPENAILVPEGRGSKFFTHEVGDGWTREGGAHRGASEFPRVTIDGWCRLGSTHWPPSTNWKDGRLVAPPERVDDVRAWAAACQRFLDRDKGTSVLLGDNNERSSTRGEFSPGWVAQQTGAKIGTSTKTKIDWGMVVGGRFENVRTSPIREGSDHEPEVMDVVEVAS
jgi:hypothetical protein